MSVLTYLSELRIRVIVCLVWFAVCFCVSCYFSDDLFMLIIRPVERLGVAHALITTDLIEAFSTKIHVALCVATIFIVPVVFWQCYKFVAPALYKREKTFLLTSLSSVLLLFTAGVFICIIHIFPLACRFLVNLQPANTMLNLKISSYLDFLLTCVTAFGIAFQTPVILVICMRLGLVNHEKLARYRKISIVIIFIIAAIITPPDVISQLAMALPMMALYELSLIIGRKMYKRDAK